MEFTAESIWSQCADIVRDNIPSAQYDQWIRPVVPVRFEDSCLWIQVPSHFYVEQLEKNYAELISKSLNRVAQRHIRLMYQVSISNASVNLPSDRMGAGNAPRIPTNTLANPFTQPKPQAQFDPQLSPSLRFSNFVAGESNKLARTAGVSIAKQPGTSIFNPLFVYGGSGVGKTHLLHAIGNAVLESNPRARVVYVSSNLFQVQYSQAFLNNKINDFIHFYQSLDVLLIDDVHELSGKTGTQNVFFHIFNHLHQTNKQIVFTCDRSPKDLEGVEERLLTRFKWGLTAEMQRPDYQLRVDILKSKIERDGLDIPQNVIEYIARNAKDNVRDLEGILTSLMAHSIINGASIDLDLCRRVVEASVKVTDDDRISIDTIEQAVCQFYHISKDYLHSNNRKQDAVVARQMVMFMARKHTNWSYAQIGQQVGGRNHATVIHACKTMSDLIETDRIIREEAQKIEQSFSC